MYCSWVFWQVLVGHDVRRRHGLQDNIFDKWITDNYDSSSLFRENLSDREMGVWYIFWLQLQMHGPRARYMIRYDDKTKTRFKGPSEIIGNYHIRENADLQIPYLE